MSKPILADDLLAKVADLERRLRILETSSQLILSSIKEGTLNILDAAGIVRVRIGKDGTDYGVKVYDAAGANAVSLATLAFGPSYDDVLPEETTTSLTFVDLATVGPTVTVTIGASGRAIVIAAAYMTSTVTNQPVIAGLKVDAAAPFDIAALGNNSGGSMAGDHAAGTLVTGLAPGPHTFKIQYLSSDGSAARFATRWLLVWPF